jgi:hypothetical protein
MWKHARGCLFVALCEVVKSRNRRESSSVVLTTEFSGSSKLKATDA